MRAFFRFIQIIFGSSGDNIFLMFQIIGKHLQKIEDLRLIVDQSQHDHTKAVLQLGVFIKLV